MRNVGERNDAVQLALRMPETLMRKIVSSSERVSISFVSP